MRVPPKQPFAAAAALIGAGLLAVTALFAGTGRLPGEPRFILAVGSAALGLLAYALPATGFDPTAFAAQARGRVGQGRWPRRALRITALTIVLGGAFLATWWLYGSASRVLAFAALAAALAAIAAQALGFQETDDVPVWDYRTVVPLPIAVAGMTGGLWLNFAGHLWGVKDPHVALVVVACLFVGFYLRRGYWRFLDRCAPHDAPVPDRPPWERIRLMRRITFLCLFAIPLVSLLVSGEGLGPVPLAASLAGALSASIGAVAERWLHIAEGWVVPDGAPPDDPTSPPGLPNDTGPA